MLILTELQIFLKIPSRTESPEKAGQSCCGVRLLLAAVVSLPGTCTWMVMGALEGELSLGAFLSRVHHDIQPQEKSEPTFLNLRPRKIYKEDLKSHQSLDWKS